MTPPAATGPVSAELDRLARWARRLGTEERLRLGCADVPPSDGAAGVPGSPARQEDLRWSGCLADLGVEELAVLVAAAPALTLVLGRCAAAPDSPARRLADLLVEVGLGHRLEICTGTPSPPARGTQHPPAPGTDLPVSRRDLFAWARRPRQQADEGPGPSHAPTGPGERRPPPERAGHGEAGAQVRLAAALRELLRQEGCDGAAVRPSGARDPGTSAGTVPSRAHDISSRGCTACRTCVRACPTDALSLRTSPDGRRATLELLPEACIGCRRCLALCPVDALSDEGALGWADVLRSAAPTALETVALKVCSRCRTPFAGEGDRCLVCSLRGTDPFGSWLPPGYVAPRVYAPPPVEEG